MKPDDFDQHRSLVDHAPTMIWSAGRDAGCDHVNTAWLAFTGRTLDDELGDGWQVSLHPDDRESYLALYLEHFGRREAYESSCRLRHHDGVYRSVAVRAAPRHDADGKFEGYVASWIDVPDREDYGFFELFHDHLCVAGFDGYWKRLNPSWTRTLGWSDRELTSRPLIEFVHPDDREATLAGRGNLKLGGPPLSQTNRYRCKDGSYRWFDWRSVADMDRQLVYAVARDVTAEHERRRALRDLTESLTATLNSITDGVVATDAKGAIARMNPVAESLTGWLAAEAAGRPLGEVFDIVRGDTRATALLPIERTLEEGLASESAEHTLLVARSGKELPIAFSRAPMRDADGTVSGAVFVIRDMTAEQQRQQEQARLQQQLMLSDRLASVGMLAAGVAHEINNPLAYVMANLDMILEDLRGFDAGPLSARKVEWIEMAEEARQGADRIRKIVRGLKTFSRAEEERRTLFDLQPVLELSVGMAFNEIRYRAKLVKDYGATPLVDADDARLGQVFINLLVNAAQAVAETSVEDSEIRLATWTDEEGCAVVEVSDTGPGIPAEVIDRVFDPFFTTKPMGVGTGLGLAITHNLVDSMGGRISVANRAEGGAAFRVTLPPASGQRTAAPETSAPKEVDTTRRAAVLVVDDERAIRATLERVLRDHDVTAVPSAREALALVESGMSFDVILSDLMMPEMSGMEFYDELIVRQAHLAERMVFITGGAFTAAAHAFLDRVPNERLDKPFDPQEVRRLVARFVS